MASHLPKFESILGESAPYVCGTETCWADFQLLYGLNYVEDILPGSLVSYPRLSTLRATLNALPRMAEFLTAQAKPLVTEQYKTEVREAM